MDGLALNLRNSLGTDNSYTQRAPALKDGVRACNVYMNCE